MSVYVQLENGKIVALYSSPQTEENCPGIQELDSDDQLVLDFVEKNKIRGLEPQ